MPLYGRKQAGASPLLDRRRRAGGSERKKPLIVLGQTLPVEGQAVGGTYLDALVDGALQFMSLGIRDVLSAFAYPRLRCQWAPGSPPVEELWSPERMMPSLQPLNLLGAMYIQFYWLVSSAGSLFRCKNCGRIITHAPPLPGGGDRKPRNDKKFCDKGCRQNYHYHNSKKSSRQNT